MNKTAIKNYAIWARVNLIEAAKQRAYQYEITKDNITDANADVVSGKPLSKEEKEQRRQLIDQINRKGFDQVMEEVAYTWFNRFIALRFMEVNGYLPTKIRVFTDPEGKFKPEILKEALTVELPVDKTRIMELLEKQENEELYKMLLIAQCNELSNGLPDMFEVISNYTELLFPNNLLKEDSILGEMVNAIPEEDWTDAVQIIGWLFESYVQTNRELYRKSGLVTKKTMAAVNQVFTPDWIVKYMVQNSFLKICRTSGVDNHLEAFEYYLDKNTTHESIMKNPTEIRFLEPCCGSGHVLVYAFDILMELYLNAGYSRRDIPELILSNNLFAFDIDDRAVQIACFSLMMKARSVDRRILSKNIRPNVYSIPDSSIISSDCIEVLKDSGIDEINISIAQYLLNMFRYGKVLGTSLIFDNYDYKSFIETLQAASRYQNLINYSVFQTDVPLLIDMAKTASLLSRQYDIVITNPPYSVLAKLEEDPKKYIFDNYPCSNIKCNFCSIFLETHLVKDGGFLAMLTSSLWTIQGSFEAIRKYILHNYHIDSMIFIGEGEVNAMTETVAFVFNKTQSNQPGVYYSLQKVNNRCDFIKTCHPKLINQDSFLQVPSTIISTSVKTDKVAYDYNYNFTECMIAKDGLHTCDNDRFLRFWYEVSSKKIAFDCKSIEESLERHAKWFPYCKGGDYKCYYGNNEYVVNWENDGIEIKTAKDPLTGKVKSHGYNGQYSFLEGFTWTYRTHSAFAARYTPTGYLFDSKGSKAFMKESYDIVCAVGFYNSLVSRHFMSLFATTAFEISTVLKVPLNEDIFRSDIKELSQACIDYSKDDWDSYESSWDFRKHPLI